MSCRNLADNYASKIRGAGMTERAGEMLTIEEDPLNVRYIEVEGKRYKLKATNSAGRGMLATQLIHALNDKQILQRARNEQELAIKYNRPPAVIIHEIESRNSED